MNARTGQAIADDAHLQQSITDVLLTPIGTRVMRRDYGSLLPELIDQPFNGATRMRVFGATAGALMRWEPRIRVMRVDLTHSDTGGAFVLDIEARRTDSPPKSDPIRITLALRNRTH